MFPPKFLGGKLGISAPTKKDLAPPIPKFAADTLPAYRRPRPLSSGGPPSWDFH